MGKVVRIGIVDDHPLLLQGILSTLRQVQGFEIVGVGHTMRDAVALARTVKPDVILLDIGIEGGGIEAAREIVKLELAIKLIMFTASDRPDHVKDALAAGVLGYVLKGASSQELCESIRIVSDGKRFITSELAMMILSLNGTAPTDPAENPIPTDMSLKNFTGREKDVIKLLSAGKSNRTIAKELILSEKTVKNHMSNIMDKLQVHSRLSAALILSKWQK
jgi:two-component system, NarL family, nitrate/nitrite response regulator NarL